MGTMKLEGQFKFCSCINSMASMNLHNTFSPQVLSAYNGMENIPETTSPFCSARDGKEDQQTPECPAVPRGVYTPLLETLFCFNHGNILLA